MKQKCSKIEQHIYDSRVSYITVCFHSIAEGVINLYETSSVDVLALLQGNMGIDKIFITNRIYMYMG